MDQDTDLPVSRPLPSLAVRITASALFTGYAPIASGTVGSALAVGFLLIPVFRETPVLVSLIIILYSVGVSTAEKMEAYYGADPAEVTIDEVVGQWITLLWIPAGLWTYLAGFLLFRFFDIIKPYPANHFDAQRGGRGIMMDDVVAGVYANIALHAILLLSPFPIG